MNALKKFIKNYTDVPENEWQTIQKAFEKRVVKKNEMIVTEGTVCRYFYFLEEGLVRYFIFNDGDDITNFFTAAPYCFTSKNSFRNQIPAQENIQALEKCILWQISLKNANNLLELRSWNTFTRKFVNEVQEQMEELLMEIKTQSAQQRYLNLQKKYPALVSKIQLKHLSSFLGIAPQSLSRIRKNMIIDKK